MTSEGELVQLDILIRAMQCSLTYGRNSTFVPAMPRLKIRLLTFEPYWFSQLLSEGFIFNFGCTWR